MESYDEAAAPIQTLTRICIENHTGDPLVLVKTVRGRKSTDILQNAHKKDFAIRYNRITWDIYKRPGIVRIKALFRCNEHKIGILNVYRDTNNLIYSQAVNMIDNPSHQFELVVTKEMLMPHMAAD